MKITPALRTRIKMPLEFSSKSPVASLMVYCTEQAVPGNRHPQSPGIRVQYEPQYPFLLHHLQLKFIFIDPWITAPKQPAVTNTGQSK